MFGPETNALISIIGSLWISVSIAVNSSKVINERRDVILSGFFDGKPLSIQHRRLMLRNDWRPMAFAAGLCSLILAIFLVYVPFALNLTSFYIGLFIVSAILPGIGVAAWWVGGWAEHKLMTTTLDSEDRASGSGTL